MTATHNLEVRPFDAADREALEAAAARAFTRSERLTFSLGKGYVLTAMADGEVVGGAVLRAVRIGDGRVGITDFIFADPRHGVPGTGRALRDAALTWFDEQGCDEAVARIAAVNSASQELHRGGGYRPLPFRQQVRRWGWRLPKLYVTSHALTDTGLRMWVRPATATDTTPPVTSRFIGTWLVNVALLLVMTWRSPRDVTGLSEALAWIPAIGLVLLGVREAVLRLVARAQGLRLGHVPWVGAGVGIGLPVALVFGAWAPIFGSSVPDRAGWRYDRDVPRLALAHAGAGALVAAIAWTTVLWAPETSLPWADLRRAAVILALLDLVPFTAVYETGARFLHDRSWWLWAVFAVIGAGPMLFVVLGWAA